MWQPRSRSQSCSHAVRHSWGTAGALDALRAGCTEARVRLCLWRKSTSSQLPIDRGSWLICQEVSLEPAPPYSVCAQHTQTQPRNKSAGGWIRGGSIAIWQAVKTTTTMWSDASYPTRILRTRHIQSIMSFPAVEPALSYTAPEPGWLSNHHSRWNMYLQKIAISWGFLGSSLRRLGLRLTYVRGSRPNVTRIRCNSLDM